MTKSIQRDAAENDLNDINSITCYKNYIRYKNLINIQGIK